MSLYVIQKSTQKVPIGKLVCLARTYQKHAREMGGEAPATPLLFLKPESAVIFNNQVIRIPKMSSCLHHEVELGVVIGTTCSHVLKKDALRYVLGYLVGLDITARDIQTEAKKQGWPWGIAKGFDTFSPISDVVLKKYVFDPNTLDLVLTVNGEQKQCSNTRYMTHSVEHIIEFVSSIMTLKQGDLILTGTPEGVGEIHDGDILDAELDNYCRLQVTVSR